MTPCLRGKSFYRRTKPLERDAADTARRILAGQMIRSRRCSAGLHAALIDALRAVPREKFFPRKRGGSVRRPAGAIGFGQTISQPYIVALMTDALRLSEKDRVLEIGTGSGYQTAILAMLAREVWSIERIKPLLDDAFERVSSLGLKNVHFRFGDGTIGWPEAKPFDRILAAAGAAHAAAAFAVAACRRRHRRAAGRAAGFANIDANHPQRRGSALGRALSLPFREADWARGVA